MLLSYLFLIRDILIIHGKVYPKLNIVEQSIGRHITRISPHLNCEPLLCKNLPEQIKIWKKHHPSAIVDLSTNCVFLTEQKFIDLYKDDICLWF